MLHHAKQKRRICKNKFEAVATSTLQAPFSLSLLCNKSPPHQSKASPSATKNDVPKFGLFRDLHLTPITLLITQLLQKKSSAISLQTQYEDK